MMSYQARSVARSLSDRSVWSNGCNAPKTPMAVLLVSSRAKLKDDPTVLARGHVRPGWVY